MTLAITHATCSPVPPGPKGLPKIGSLLDCGRDLLGFFRHCASYGDLSHFNVFSYDFYLLNHPEIVKQVLVQTNSRSFSKKQEKDVMRVFFGNGLLTSNGSYWLRQRRLMQPAFHRKLMADYGQIMISATEELLNRCRPGQERDLNEDMMNLTLEISARAFFSTELGDDANEIRAAFEEIRAAFNKSLGTVVLDFLLSYTPLPNDWRFRKAIRRLDRVAYNIIRQRRLDPEPPDDLLSMLIQARDKNGQPLTDRQLRDELVTLLFVGHETTALALTWTWYLLATHPDVEAKLVNELQAVLAGRTPAAADVPDLPYTESVLKESMRLYPPVWGMDLRIAVEDCEIDGYPIAKGSILIASQWLLHRNPRWFSEPDQFLPERWTKAFTKKLPDYAYFPFGGGPRLCLGAGFAMLEAILIVATMAQKYRFTLVPDQMIEPEYTLTLQSKHGLKVILEEREAPTGHVAPSPIPPATCPAHKLMDNQAVQNKAVCPFHS